MDKIKIGNRWVGRGEPCFIIAEAGSNHDGRLEQAHQLIDIAADSGADAVKFQLFKAEYLYPPNVGVVDTPAGPIEFFKFLQAASLPEDWLPSLIEHTKQRGLVFLASVFDEGSADVLEHMKVEAHKIASPELTHLPLIRHIARFGKALIISTGMARLSDIEDAIDTIVQAGNNQVILFHCVSAYPTPPEDCNLNVLTTLARAFQLPVGFSDHTTEPTAAPCAAVALGGCVIEKHFTLDRALPGPDHPFALEPKELAEMVRAIRILDRMSCDEHAKWLVNSASQNLLGSPVKHTAPSEKDLADNDRRTIMVIRDIESGERITEESLRILRAERNLKPGLLPKYWDVVLNARAVRRIPSGRGLVWDDLITRG